MRSFSNRAAIVIGGGPGIGKEVAKRLVEAGAAIVIGGRDAAKLAWAASEIDASGAASLPAATDRRDRE